MKRYAFEYVWNSESESAYATGPIEAPDGSWAPWSDVEALEAELRSYKESFDDLAGEMTEIVAERDALKAEVGQQHQTIKHLNDDVNTTIDHVAEYKAEVEQLRAELAHKDVRGAQIEIRALKAEVERLRRDLRVAEALKKHLGPLPCLACLATPVEVQTDTVTTAALIAAQNDNARLRAALAEIRDNSATVYAREVAREALEVKP